MLSKRGYVLKKVGMTEEEMEAVREEFTVEPFTMPGTKREEPFKVFMENGKKFYLPKVRAQELYGKAEKSKIPPGEDRTGKGTEFNGSLRDFQVEIVDSAVKACRERGGGMLICPGGKGKTVMAINAISQLKKKTLVVVHKNFLANQWSDRILGKPDEKTGVFKRGFMPDAKIGKIQGSVFDIEDKDVVIATLQSLSQKSFPLGAFDSFGLIIIDECHRSPCRVFSRALIKTNCIYSIGLTATPRRRDGLMKVLKWFIGDIFYELKDDSKSNDRKVSVIRYSYDSIEKEHLKTIYKYDGSINTGAMMGNLCEYKPRTGIICDKVWQQALEGRTTIVLSERRAHLEEICELFRARVAFNLRPFLKKPVVWDNLKKLNDDFINSKVKNFYREIYGNDNDNDDDLDDVLDPHRLCFEDIERSVYEEIFTMDTVKEAQHLAYELYHNYGTEMDYIDEDFDVHFATLSEELVDYAHFKQREVILNEWFNILTDENPVSEKEYYGYITQFYKDAKLSPTKMGKLTKVLKKAGDNEMMLRELLGEFKVRDDFVNSTADIYRKYLRMREIFKRYRKIAPRVNKEKRSIMETTRNGLVQIFKIYIYNCLKKRKLDGDGYERDPCCVRVDYYVGGMGDKDLKSSELCEIILGTYQMASTGLDIPSLNTLMMATPKSSTSAVFEQATWRIMRKEHPVFKPLIMDFCDIGGTYREKGAKRLTYFKKKKYNVKTIVLDEDGAELEVREEPLTKKKSPKKRKAVKRGALVFDKSVSLKDQLRKVFFEKK